MSSAVDVIKNLDRRVFALESERFDETSGAVVQIDKLYADVDVSVKLTAYLHKYHRCGEQVGSVAVTGAQSNPNIYTIRTSPYLRL